MKTYSFYGQHTGLFHQQRFTTDDLRESVILANTPLGHVAIEGIYDALSQLVDTTNGKVVDYQPVQPSADHEWNQLTKRWQLSADAANRQQKTKDIVESIAIIEASQARAVREAMLGYSDALSNLKEIDRKITVLRSQLAELQA